MEQTVPKFIEITPNITINTILNGLWQLSGGHGQIEPKNALKAMKSYHKADLVTWDLADHYGFAEDLVGMYQRSAHRNETSISPRFLTKWVPRPGRMTRDIVETAINRSLRRMEVEALDMLQFHWWDYQDTNYLRALEILNDLRKDGKIRLISLTNFDTTRLKIILENGIPVISNQIQFSVLDQRPFHSMIPFCQKNGIKLLAYGTLGGGLYTNRYLNRPTPAYGQLNTSSLQKYYGMIRRWGSWDLYQRMLGTLSEIAKKHEVSIANIAVRYILEQPTVAGTIIGARLSLSNHVNETLKVYSFHLDSEDHYQIRNMYTKGTDLYSTIGDCGDEYR
jgi:aryl-alcohol dehydrogenase-like predicted oxidoreductase